MLDSETNMADENIDPRWGTPSPLHDPYALANFKPRASDILITTAPKAGTTWMQQILHQLRSGGDDSFTSIYDVVPWLEYPRRDKTWQEVLKEYDELPDPRIFKTHCTWSQTPGNDRVRIILTSRDPRDCCVSFYHHIMDMTEEAREEKGIGRPDSFDDFFEIWMDFAAWFRNVQSWWPHYDDDNVLWLRYEDLKTDFEQGMDQVLEFLGWSITAEQRQRVLELCSFEWMKANSDRFTRHSGEDTHAFKKGGFIRKGRIGDHKNLLTPEHIERIMGKARQMLEPDCLAYLDLD